MEQFQKNGFNGPLGENDFRKLSIDFELHTDGDPVFKQELIALMVGNLHDLAESVLNARNQNNHQVFLKMVHKVTSTVGMVDDIEFSNIILELKETDINTALYQEKSALLQRLCQAIIRGLQWETENNTRDLASSKAA